MNAIAVAWLGWSLGAMTTIVAFWYQVRYYKLVDELIAALTNPEGDKE